jgi:hypothetical protein
VWTDETTVGVPVFSAEVLIDVADLAGQVTEQVKHS